MLKTFIPAELLNHPKIKTILLCHQEVPNFLKSIIDDIGPQVSISIFDDYNKLCEIKTDHLGLVALDVRCNAVNVVGAIAACKRKLRRLVMRNYEWYALIDLDRNVVLETSDDDISQLNATTSEPKAISLEGMTNLQKLLLCAMC